MADRLPVERPHEKPQPLATIVQKAEILRLLNEEWVTSQQKNSMILHLNTISKQRAERALRTMRHQKRQYEKARTLSEALFQDKQLGPLLNAAGFCEGDRVITEIAEGVVTIQKF